MNDLQVFNNPEFGEMRTVEIDGEPWFVGKDVATALGYKDTVNALKAHVDDEDKTGWQIATQFGEKETTIINESGVYSLIFSSRMEKAKAFKRWVTSEVLPAIRKHGAYIAPQAQPAALDAAAMQSFASAVDTLSGMVQTMARMIDALGQPPGRTALPALTGGDNPFDDLPVSIKPPSNKMRRKWMSTASDKLNALAEKCGLPSSTVLHRLYQEMEDEQGVILNEVRMKALEEHQLTDCSFLLAIFYDAPLRQWFEQRVDSYLTPETPMW